MHTTKQQNDFTVNSPRGILYDDTPRAEMIRELLPEVELELEKRKAVTQ